MADFNMEDLDDFRKNQYRHPETDTVILSEDMPWELIPEPMTKDKIWQLNRKTDEIHDAQRSDSASRRDGKTLLHRWQTMLDQMEPEARRQYLEDLIDGLDKIGERQ